MTLYFCQNHVTLKLSVIIVNYNVKYFLEQALLSVRRASGRLDVEVIVVDNNSVDDSLIMLAEKFPEVKVMANQENVGFSKANNQALNLARGEYVLLLNPDTVVEEDTFRKCIRFMDEHPEAGALGVKMIDGSGRFLPESKRGFPSPMVAFYKMFGLAELFPRSPLFNHYHLGYLDKDENHEVEILSGAFMFIRRAVLEITGFLDEAFFMYGEDIDLSYRIIQAGYKNYYFAGTTIIHYKGESTKKGSLNYIRVFYNAMIIFARKHFEGEQAALFVLLLKIAIYAHAALTLASNWIKHLYLPFIDLAVIFSGLVFLKQFWAVYHFGDPNYYNNFIYYNMGLYTLIWVASIFAVGGYDDKGSLRTLSSGILIGSLFIAAIYGFLEMDYRSSRALIVLGTFWSFIILSVIRFVDHFLRYKNFKLGNHSPPSLVIVGTLQESLRVKTLLQEAQVQKNIVGTIAPRKVQLSKDYLSAIDQLDEIVQIYKIDEIIFCSRDLSTQAIMNWMVQLGSNINYKIIPEESLSIIGSSSKNKPGELYTIEIAFQIDRPVMRRQKRMFDLLVCLIMLVSSPFIILLTKNNLQLLVNIFHVFSGKKSWVGYASGMVEAKLPPIKKGVLNPIDEFKFKDLSQDTIRRLDFVYAKNYSLEFDLNILIRGLKHWSRN